MTHKRDKKEDFRETLGIFIKKRREELNLTKEELANKMGYGLRLIESVETSKFDYNISILLNICEALEVDLIFDSGTNKLEFSKK